MHLEIQSFALLAAADHGALAQLPLTLLMVFGSAKLLSALFERIGQPGIVGQILAGILIGPAVLNWVQPSDLLEILAELGVIFLLFQVGLEVKASDIWQVGKTALVVAVMGVVVPFLLGWWIMLMAGEPKLEAIFIGTAMVATSIGITAQVLAAKGWLQHTASKIILAAAVIDDVLGLLILAIVSSVSKGDINWIGLGTTAAVAIGFTLLIATFGTRTVKRVVPGLKKRLEPADIEFDLALILLFGLSLLALYAGVAAIIGAFLAGMALSETVESHVHHRAHGITEFLLPFFLVGIGIHMDLSALADRRMLILTLVIVIAAVASKLIGCGLGAVGMSRIDRLRIGAGMVPRGEVGMIVAQIGLAQQVISKPVYGVVVFMSILTTMVAPALLNYAFRDAVARQTDEENISVY